jgi:hypothetical protein
MNATAASPVREREAVLSEALLRRFDTPGLRCTRPHAWALAAIPRPGRFLPFDGQSA